MRKPLRSNPLFDQTIRASRWPSLRVTFVLLIVLLTGAMAVRGWLNDSVPPEARAILLLLLWLLPLVTMAVAAVSTARRLRTESFQLVKQSPLTDRQVTWGLGLSTLYTLRVMLVIAFGLLPALVDDTPLGGASTALCLAGLHLAASMLGTVLVLRWGRQRLGVVLAAIVCTLIVALLPTLKVLNPACVPIVLNTTQFRLSTLLLNQGAVGAVPLVAAAILPILLGSATSLIPWRDREEGWRLRLEMMGMVLTVGLALGLRIFDTNQLKERERQALVAIYYATDGDNWSQNNGWLSDQPADSWYGVRCTCDRVVGLFLSENNLHGELPPEIGQLVSLQELGLWNNQLSKLPSEIDQLTSLQQLVLNNNWLSQMPPGIGQLTNLRRLELRDNQLSTLPPDISHLDKLVSLVVSGNKFSKLPPEIGHLTSLQQLWLESNQLTELPPEIGRLTNLQLLYLSGNKLSKLPPDFGRLDNLLELHLSNNQITNPPPQLGQLTNLRWLYLDSNPLLELPPEICQLPNLIDVMPPSLCD